MHLGIWQEDARDPSFRRDVFDELIRHMRRRGWTVGPDAEVRKRYPRLSGDHRRCRKGALRATLEVSGRHVGLESWAETWPKVNPNGHRYDCGRRARLGYLDGLRYDLEIRHLVAWARERFDAVAEAPAGVGPSHGGPTALEWIAGQYARSWHIPARPGWPKGDAYSVTSADGGTVTQGAEVWLRGRSGRWLRGRAYANNSMWWVVLGPHELDNRSASELHLAPPIDFRQKSDAHRRRIRLEREMARAIGADDFTRAGLLKRILFGDAPVYRILKHEDGGAWYAPGYAGYAGDLASAGRYTREEAEREVLRVPHRLTLVCPDGRRIRGEALRAAAMEAAHGRA